MEQLIPVINKLQDVFHSVGMLDTIDLPQIAVVGSQSSGKSSVLENIVGRDFLPRGSGIVTRRPLVLQLINIPKGEKEWGEFLHAPKKKFEFQEIRQEIVAETDRVTGKNKGVSPLPIHLKIFSPNVLNLTLVDLPGITKVPIGDQPKDIEEQIRKMLLQFISKPNCIILAISPANADLANSDALKLSEEVDKKGVRTLGVLTKLDLMDEGTDALDILNGKVYQLRRGFIGVVNRSQKDIDTQKSITKSLEDEENWFKNHKIYGQVASRCGTNYLARTLNSILLSHIRSCLPDIKNKIQALMLQAQQRLQTYGTPLAETNMSQGALLLQLVTQFTQTFVDAIDGRIVSQNTNELFGGARINNIFVKKYTPYLLKMDACENLSEDDIKICIRNAKGPRTSLFVPEAAFEMLVKRQVKLLEDPSIRCVDNVFDELLTVVDFCDKDLTRFPVLRERLKEFVVQLLRNYLVPLKDFIRDLISIEIAYINTNHPDFFGGGSTAITLIEKLTIQEQQNQSKEKEQKQQVQQVQKVEQKVVPKVQTQKVKEDEDWFSVDPPPGYGKTLPPQKKLTLPQTKPQQPQQQQQPKQDQQQQKGFFKNFFGQQVTNIKNEFFDDLEDESNTTYQQQEQVYQQQQQQLSESEIYNQTFSDREKMELNIIKALLGSYFSIIRKNVSDSVPKAIMCFLVNKSKSEMQNELVKNLYKEELFNDLLKENDDIAAKRKATAKMLEVLSKANQIINEVKDLKI